MGYNASSELMFNVLLGVNSVCASLFGYSNKLFLMLSSCAGYSSDYPVPSDTQRPVITHPTNTRNPLADCRLKEHR